MQPGRHLVVDPECVTLLHYAIENKTSVLVVKLILTSMLSQLTLPPPGKPITLQVVIIQY